MGNNKKVHRLEWNLKKKKLCWYNEYTNKSYNAEVKIQKKREFWLQQLLDVFLYILHRAIANRKF